MHLDFVIRLALDGKEVDPRLAALLDALRSHGSLAAAARSLGCSYRFAWDCLRKAQHEYGHALVHLERGRGARLTEVAQQLTDAQSRARMATQRILAGVARESEARIGKVASPHLAQLALAASHDLGLIELKDYCATTTPAVALDVRFCGSLDALSELSRGRCDVAGFHVSSESSRNESTVHRMLSPRLHRLIEFCDRSQGLIVAPGNPKKIRRMSDLTRRGVRFVNRQAGSGTRLLLDRLLAQSDTPPTRIRGYETEEFTHVAVAATIASRHADAGFGIEAAAARYGLEFIPITRETYYLATRASLLDRLATRALLEHLRSRAWHKRLDRLPGYRAQSCGTVVNVETAFPRSLSTREPGA